MHYQGFIATVEEEAHVSEDEAGRAACATLTTLAERLSSGETEDIAEHLPSELRGCLESAEDHAAFDVDEFLRRVARRVGTDEPTAEREATAVFAALLQAVGPDEFADMRSELPKDFDPLLDEAVRAAPAIRDVGDPPPDHMPYDEFVARVAQRAGIDRDRASRAIDAVLEMFSIRITDGEVEDLERPLPRELRPPMERGRAVSRGKAVPLSLDAFLEGIQKREGGDRSEATQHARAVLLTLREAVGEQEWSDAVAQLPRDYRDLWKQG